MRRVSGKRGPGQPRRPTHPRGQREGGKERATFAPTARPRAGSRVPGDSGVGADPSPRPSTHSASGQQESHSPRPPPSVPPGEGAGGRFRAPLFLPTSAGSRAAAQSVWPGPAGPPGHPLTPTPAPPPPRPTGRTDWLVLPPPGKETPGDWP